jgi:LacI family transcriptional regulator
LVNVATVLGAIAAEHLFAALNGESRSGIVRQPCRLVVRESTGPGMPVSPS